MIIPACTLAFIAWADYGRMLRVDFVSRVASEESRIDADSVTGYADGKRWLVVPEHNNPTYQWIEETQLMLARGDWRVRSVDYENSPFGREVHAASPYRWWLLAVGWCYHEATGRPMGLSIERAALFADPLLQLILLVTATLFVARRFGILAAMVVSLGIAGAYPLAAAFLPGIANDYALSQVAAFWSVLLVVAGALAPRRTFLWFFAAGAAGGCGMWLSASGQVPVVIGIALGALVAAGVSRIRAQAKEEQPLALPWRAWAFGGAVTSLLAYLVEYFPNHMGPELRVNYPLYGVAWIGLGEVLRWFARWMRREGGPGGRRNLVILSLSVAAVVSLPIAISRSGDHAFLAGDLLSTRLTNLPDGVVAGSMPAWAAQGGLNAPLAATLLLLLLVVPAAWVLAKRGVPSTQRLAVALAMGPVMVAVAMAAHQIRWWNSFDVALLPLLVAATVASAAAAKSLRQRLLWAGAAALPLAVGAAALIPARSTFSETDFKFTRAEIEGLYERALAHWISDRVGPDGATVLLPPFRTSSFCFYGSLRGLGTQNWENRDGLSATFRIVNSTRPDETLALVNQRGITHIVIPSWDTDLDDFARMGLKQPMDSFIFALHQTDGGIFNWLRALPYNLPAVQGFKEQSVLVLEVTDETDPATLRSRLVEYLVEMHQLDAAAYSSKALSRYPADLGALVALAEVQKAREDDDAFGKAFNAVLSNLSSGTDRSLAWDRRVSLAVVLALGKRSDLSREQVRRCMADINEARIRSLTTGSLYHLLVMAKAYGFELSDAKLQGVAMKLLPSELRERL